MYANHALCNYYLAWLAYQSGQYATAETFFTKAKDLDGLRFRAPQEVNDIIATLSKNYSNTHVVNTKAAFEKWSPHGVIGGDLVLEHVHPNLTGYALLSDAFYEALKSANIIPVDPQKEMSLRQLLVDMPVTKIDSLAGLYKVARLKQSWPFSEALQRSAPEEKTTEAKLARKLIDRKLSWQQATDSLYTYYIGRRDLRNAKRVMENLVLEYPEDPVFYERAAMLSGELKDYKNAILYFTRAFRLAPTFEKAKYLFVIYLKVDKPLAAMPYLDYAIAHANKTTVLLPIKAYTEKIIQLEARLRKRCIEHCHVK